MKSRWSEFHKHVTLGLCIRFSSCDSSWPKTKKADVIEHQNGVGDHVGLLCNKPSGEPDCPLISRPMNAVYSSCINPSRAFALLLTIQPPTKMTTSKSSFCRKRRMFGQSRHWCEESVRRNILNSASTTDRGRSRPGRRSSNRQRA